MVSTLYCSSTQLYLMDCLEKKKWIEMGLGKGSIPELGRSLGEGMATHSSVLAWRSPMDRWAQWAVVHMVAKSWTRLK